MKIKITILLMSLLVLIPSGLYGQHLSKIDLIVNGGIGFPVDPRPWADNWKWGLNGGAGLSYRISPFVSIDTHLDYYSFLFDDWNFNARLPFTEHLRNVESTSSSIIGLSAQAKYMLRPFSENLSPYLTGGAGVQRFAISDIRITEHTWEGIPITDETTRGSTTYGLFVIAGAGINLVTDEKRSYFIEAKYGVGFSGDNPNHFFPVRVGFRHRIN
jgi:opacity protein-like surface antigen